MAIFPLEKRLCSLNKTLLTKTTTAYTIFDGWSSYSWNAIIFPSSDCVLAFVSFVFGYKPNRVVPLKHHLHMFDGHGNIIKNCVCSMRNANTNQMNELFLDCYTMNVKAACVAVVLASSSNRNYNFNVFFSLFLCFLLSLLSSHSKTKFPISHMDYFHVDKLNERWKSARKCRFSSVFGRSRNLLSCEIFTQKSKRS